MSEAIGNTGPGISTIGKELFTTPIKVRFFVGPIGLITIDAEGIPDQIVLLIRRTTEEFIAVGIIAKPSEAPAVAVEDSGSSGSPPPVARG